MAIGNADALIYPNNIDIHIGSIQIVRQSSIVTLDNEEALTNALQEKEITITVDLNIGEAKAQLLTCDLTYDYVKINSAYTT